MAVDDRRVPLTVSWPVTAAIAVAVAVAFMAAVLLVGTALDGPRSGAEPVGVGYGTAAAVPVV